MKISIDNLGQVNYNSEDRTDKLIRKFLNIIADFNAIRMNRADLNRMKEAELEIDQFKKLLNNE